MSNSNFASKQGEKRESSVISQSKKEEKTEVNPEEKKKEIEQKVEEEKKRIREEFLKYEEQHLDLWDEMVKSMQNEDVYSAYYYADKSEKSLLNIWREIRSLKCNKTGDDEFDKQCKGVIKSGNTAYLLKQEAAKKLMVWFEDLNSPKKATGAKEALEQAVQSWKAFQFELALITMSQEELQKYQKKAEKENSNKKK
ncbi:MAG: hypothetical protein Q4D53_06165 [Leptotrichiaceae bacterium]|nr:hypothetical protein [Leptotrichiaceae bacterium]